MILLLYTLQKKLSMIFNVSNNHQIAYSCTGCPPHLICASLGPQESLRNGISIDLAVFAGLTNVTHRQTHKDHTM